MRPWKAVYGQIDLKHARIYMLDGGSNEIEITIGEGNLTWSEKVNREYVLDRGTLDEVRNGDEVPVDLSMSFKWDYIRSSGESSAAPPSPVDVLKNQYNAATWVSSDADACRPFAVDLKIEYRPTPTSCGDMELILFADFRYEDLSFDLRAGTIACSGKCNATAPTLTRTAQS